MERSRNLRIAVAGLVLVTLAVPWAALAHDETTIAELKGRLSSVDLRDRPALCIEICERQLDAADKFYNLGAAADAQAALADVVSFAALAREYAIQSHKHEKQSEIALRKAVRKLADLKHAISREDQTAVQNAIDRIQHFRDDLLSAMFPRAEAK
ncbi:MAG: hypothetical protein WA252_15925 [Candidatus Sulfotelmatobacter sp.]|jgi:hypothetical protein